MRFCVSEKTQRNVNCPAVIECLRNASALRNDEGLCMAGLLFSWRRCSFHSMNPIPRPGLAAIITPFIGKVG